MTICDVHRRDLEASGLSEESISAAGLRCGDRNEVREILKFDPHCGGLLFSYPGTNGKGPAFIRVKPDRPFLDRYGKPSKYLSPKGAGNRLFIPHRVEDVLSDHKMPLWVTEGEKKALRAVQDGLQCIAIPGVWSWRMRKGSSRSVPIPDLDLVTWKGRTVFLVFDSDLRANKQVATALYELSRELERRGARVSKIDLPDGPGGEKVGLDDYLVSHSVETLCEIEPSPVLPPEFAYIEIMPVTDFVKKTLPNREAIIGNGILYPQSRIGITGPGKALKSMFLQNMILALSAGVPFLGFRIPKPRGVLYVQSEVSGHAMQDRLGRMTSGNPGLNFTDAMLVNAHNLKIDTREGLRTIEHLVERSRAEVVFFDPLYRLHSKDENKAQEMRAVVDLFEGLIETFGIALGAVHHHAKGVEGKDDGQLARGSTIFGDWVDSQLVLRGTTEGRYRKRLSFVLRNDAEPEPFHIVLDPETLWFRRVGPDEVAQDRQSEAEDALKAARAIFDRGDEVTAAAMETELGVVRQTALNRMTHLERYGWERSTGKRGAIVYRPGDLPKDGVLEGLEG